MVDGFGVPHPGTVAIGVSPVARLDGRCGTLKDANFLAPIVNGTPMVGDMASVGDGVDDSEDVEQQDDDDDAEDEEDADSGDGDEGGDVGVVGSFSVNRGGTNRPPLNPHR